MSFKIPEKDLKGLEDVKAMVDIIVKMVIRALESIDYFHVWEYKNYRAKAKISPGALSIERTLGTSGAIFYVLEVEPRKMKSTQGDEYKGMSRFYNGRSSKVRILRIVKGWEKYSIEYHSNIKSSFLDRTPFTIENVARMMRDIKRELYVGMEFKKVI